VARTLPEHLRGCCTRYNSLLCLYTHLSLTPTRLAIQVGLLSKDNTEKIPFAYKLYKSSSSSNEALAREFKETFCRPVPIEFVGCMVGTYDGTKECSVLRSE
jgi:hypothetical protein